MNTLYKVDSKGAVRMWSITVQEGVTESLIITTHGLKDGKLQEDIEIISEGKNIGKSNETDHYTQALAEADSRHTKKRKSGYVDDIELAIKGKTDPLIGGGVNPMLATPLEKVFLVDEYLIQPKLDGIRCIATPDENGNYTLWTRTRKPITSCPHIIGRLNHIGNGNTFDGELYNHDLKEDFESIVSAVRKEEPSEESESVQYWIYDIINDDKQRDRIEKLRNFPEDIHKIVIKVPTLPYDKEGPQTEDFIKEGYEGSILRNTDSYYENRRSKSLIKVKTFIDDEFEVVGIEEGKGRLSGHCGSFICKTREGSTFNVKMEGSHDMLKYYLDHFETFIGKMLQVRFFSYTNKNKVPRFPVGVRFRNDLDF